MPWLAPSVLWCLIDSGRTTSAAAGTVGLNGASVATSNKTTTAVSSNVVDPQLLDVLQKVAAGGLPPETAARHLRELGAGYQQVMDFAQVLHS